MTTFTLTRALAATALALGIAHSRALGGSNIVVNGGFETGDFTGWSLSGNTVFTFIDGGSAQTGSYGVFTGPLGSWGYITQTLSTVPGKTYELEYWLANSDYGPNGFQIRWAGQIVGASLVDSPPFAFKRFKVTGLIATGTTTTLTFAFQHDPSFFSFDNVSVVANEVPADIAMMTATTADSQRIDFTYSISDASVGPFQVSVYRSADENFDAGTDVLIGSTTITDVTTGSGSVFGNLTQDPAHPFVLVVADAANGIQEINEANNTASFRKRVVGVVTYGYKLVADPFSPGGLPGWVDEMATALERRGYSKALKVDWSTFCNTPSPGQTTAAATQLVSQLNSAIQSLDPLPTDVIDIHWIGHSRGAVVNGQALQMMVQNGTIPAAMARGWIKMTMLDPHPARNGPMGPLCSFDAQSPIGWLLFISCAAFQATTQDPDAIFPNRVNQPEVFFQHTRYSDAPSWERFLNLWGVSNIIPTSHDWTHAGIGHAEITEAYRIAEIETTLASTSTAEDPAGTSEPASVPQSVDEPDKLFPHYVNNRGLAQSLITKLATARAAFDRGNIAAGRGALVAFIDQVKAQRGSHITTEAADLLIASASSVLSTLK